MDFKRVNKEIIIRDDCGSCVHYYHHGGTMVDRGCNSVGHNHSSIKYDSKIKYSDEIDCPYYHKR